MTIAQGSFMKVVAKRETAWGVKPATAGARYLRRVTSSLQKSRDALTSNEIREDQQVAVHRLGFGKVEGDLNAELSPGSYADFLAAVLRREFTAGLTITGGVAVTDNVLSGPAFAIAGFKPGHIVRATGLGAAADNARNLVVLAVTADSITVDPLVGADLADAAVTAGVTVAMVGAQTYVPEAGHTNVSFAIEHFYEDVSQSELFTGVKFGDADIKLSPAGMAELALKMMGRDMEAGQVAFFQNPAPTSTTNVLAPVNGRIYALGKRLTLLTDLSISIKGDLSTEPVVGSDVAADIFRGRVQVSGEMSAYFDTGELRDAFLAEQEIQLFAVFTLNQQPDAGFVAFRLPRVKLSGATKADGEKGVVQSVPFVALKAAGDTTFAIQDSTVVV